MANRKEQIRKIVLDILFEREVTRWKPTQFENLAVGVAEVIENRESGGKNQTAGGFSSQLGSADKMILQEVFWDLFVNKIITLGMNEANPGYPWFRLHSEAEQNINRT